MTTETDRQWFEKWSEFKAKWSLDIQLLYCLDAKLVLTTDEQGFVEISVPFKVCLYGEKVGGSKVETIKRVIETTDSILEVKLADYKRLEGK